MRPGNELLRPHPSSTASTAHDSPAPDPAGVLRYSRGANKYDNMPSQREAADWASFVDAVLADRQARKGLGYIAAPFALEGAVHHRCSAGCLPRAWHPLDLDEISPEPAKALLEAMRAYCGVAWTTHSHTPEAPRLRLLVKLSRPVSRDENVRLGKAFERELRGAVPELRVDQSVYRGEQPVYLPPTSCTTWRFDGQALAVDELLAQVPPPAPVIVRELAAHEVPGADEIVALLAEIPNDDPGLEYDQWVAALAVVHRYLGDGGKGFALDFSTRCPRHNPQKFEKTWASFSRPYVPSTGGRPGFRPATIRTLQRLAALRYLPAVEAMLRKGAV